MMMTPITCKGVTMRFVVAKLPFHLLICLQDYGFDYSENDEAEDTGDVDVENLYYVAKCAGFFHIGTGRPSDTIRS